MNYSSIRAGLLEEREEWKATQGWLIATSSIHFSVNGSLTHYSAMHCSFLHKRSPFRESNGSLGAGRGLIHWDVQANVVAVKNGFKSRRGVVSEAGGDYETVVEEIAQDQELAEGKGVELGMCGPKPTFGRK